MSRKMLFIGVVLALLFVLLAGTVWAQGDAAKGKTLWAQYNCKSCHGANGEGKYAGVRAGDGKPLADWLKQVRTPRAVMPAYAAAQVSDADITDMWAYMQTLAKPAAFTPMTYTAQAGDPPGKVLFAQKRCWACHGETAFGAGLVKTRFTDKGRPVTAEAVLKQLRTPAEKMPTFSAAQVSDAEAAQIADFLKTLVPAVLPTTGERWPVERFALLGLAVVVAGIGVWRLAVARR